MSRSNKLLWLGTMCALDAGLTYYAVYSGLFKEINPVLGFLMGKMGLVATLVIPRIGAMFLAMAVSPKMLTFITAFETAVVLWNIGVLVF